MSSCDYSVSGMGETSPSARKFVKMHIHGKIYASKLGTDGQGESVTKSRKRSKQQDEPRKQESLEICI
jgi:hypothetical protein